MIALKESTFAIRPVSGMWVLACVMLLLPLPSYAWNAAGHRLIAAIAWEQLDGTSRAEAARLLRAHPEYSRWLKRAGETVRALNEPDRAAFIESSTWADDVRKDNRFYDADRNPPTETIAGYPDMERHRDWHFVNGALDGPSVDGLRQPTVRGQLDQQLPAQAMRLRDPDTPLRDRAYALPWLVHLVGDAHQPLHASVYPGPGDNPDERFRVMYAYRSSPQSSTLHAFWDDLPGPPWLRGEDLDAAYPGLLALYPRPAPSLIADWIEESRQLAQHRAYPPETGDRHEIKSDFVAQSQDVVNRRITEGGYRLAELLRETLESRRRSAAP